MDATVAVQVVFDATAGGFAGATLRVTLEEASHADAPARVVTTALVADCAHTPGEPPLEVYLHSDGVDPRARYQVRAHLGRHGGSGRSVGDQITTVSYPVITHGYPDSVTVAMHRIR